MTDDTKAAAPPAKPTPDIRGRTGRVLDIDSLAAEFAKRDVEGFHAAATLREQGLNPLSHPAPAAPAQADAPRGLMATIEDSPDASALEPSDTDAAASADPPAGAISSLSDLAQALELDMDSLLNVRATTRTIDGVETSVPLKEALSSFRQQGHITRQSQELAAERKKATEEHAARLATVDTRLAEMTAALELSKKMFLHEVDKTEWDKLRADDPQEFILKRFDYDKKREVLNEAIADHLKAIEARNAEHKVAREAFERAEYERLMEAVPEWNDAALQRKELEQVKDYALNGRGLTPAELGNVSDHRYFLILRDAARYHALRSQSMTSVPRPANVTVRTQPRTAGLAVSAKALATARAAFKRSGSDADAAAVLAAKRAGQPKPR